MPLTKDMVATNKIIKVVSFIPEAVDALPPPINIRSIVKNKVGSSIAPVLIVLNPAVLGVTA